MTITLKDEFKTPIAVVDWLSFTIELIDNSHAGYLKNTYEHLGVSRVEALNEGAGGAANRFKIYVQHPDNYQVIKNFVNKLEDRYGLANKPKLDAIEVSIDFYHKHKSIIPLKTMTERLMVSITPPESINPRIYGKTHDFTGGHMPKRSHVKGLNTFYIGNLDDEMYWRVYFKRTDDTYIGENNKRLAKPLRFNQFRARVEVCLQHQALSKFNLTLIDDLSDLKFEKLYSEGLFRFTKRNNITWAPSSNKYSAAGFASLGVISESPACILNMFHRKDARKRSTKLSKFLSTDKELSEAARYALRRLTNNFSLTS